MAAPIATLHHETIHAPGAVPRHRIGVLHGIFGRGRNLATIARRLVERRPEWAALLVDLPGHGDSLEAGPPWTLEACAEQVAALGPMEALLGHSYGGKVALAAIRRIPALRQVWVIDSDPGAGGAEGDVLRMVAALHEHPGPFADRREAERALAGKFPPTVVTWMLTNLRRRDAGWEWRFPLAGVESLLRDYFAIDLTGVLRDPAGPEIHLVRATKSPVLDPA
jgi:pimeloyl-ACP methyl ester carboxylesterase